MPRKAPVVWYPAHENNYMAADRPTSHRIYRIVIHVTQGSWSGAINWFQNSHAVASAHYTVRSCDGKIAQSVSDINIAYHAGQWPYNLHSLGIEHEGYIDDSKWFTPDLYHASAELVAYLCTTYGTPIDRQHIIGHDEVPGCPGEGGGEDCHTDPGSLWWWGYYMRLVRRYAAT
jgi:N-acetyl-anhydromuramyl-L-alanine amidase AmpD